MFRRISPIFVGVVALAFATPARAQEEASPSFSILLPSNIPSWKVQISYFLIGPFGGYGGYAAPRFDATSYEIPTVVDGKPATELRAIVYAPGCEIQKLVVPLIERSQVTRAFACQPVEKVRLSGQIVPSELARYGNAEVVVTYMALWAHGFFGIVDGPVTQFELTSTPPRADGRFEVDLPLLSQEATQSEPQASLCLMLRDSRTLNHIASNLEPDEAEFRTEERCQQTRNSYPSDLEFTAVHFEKSNFRGKVFRSDSGESISNSYIELVSAESGEKVFDTRTGEDGSYVFPHIPPGRYAVSISAWFQKRDEVPSRDSHDQRTTDGGDVTVEWQWKSRAFMEIVRIKSFSIDPESENVKDFDLVGK